MNIQTLFDQENVAQLPKPIKFKVIKPVFETLTVKDEVSRYNNTRYTDPQQVYDAFRWLNQETK